MRRKSKPPLGARSPTSGKRLEEGIAGTSEAGARNNTGFEVSVRFVGYPNVCPGGHTHPNIIEKVAQIANSAAC